MGPFPVTGDAGTDPVALHELNEWQSSCRVIVPGHCDGHENGACFDPLNRGHRLPGEL